MNDEVQLPAEIQEPARVRLGRWLIGLGLVVVVIVSVAAWFLTRETLPPVIRVATAAPGGLYHKLGKLLEPQLEKRARRPVELVETEGTIENQRLLYDPTRAVQRLACDPVGRREDDRDDELPGGPRGRAGRAREDRARRALHYESLRGDVNFTIFLQQCGDVIRRIQNKLQLVRQGVSFEETDENHDDLDQTPAQ